MISFVLGLAAGATVYLNGKRLRKAAVRAALKGGETVAAAGRGGRRFVAGVVSDFEDAVAEVQAERQYASLRPLAQYPALQQELERLRDEIASITAHIRKTR